MPFKGNTVAALKHAILDGKFEIPENLSESCMELIRGILRRKPEWRLNMNQVFSFSIYYAIQRNYNKQFS